VQDYWLPTPLACFPFTSPPMRHRAPSGSERAIPETLIQEVIRENYDPIFVVHPGIQRTYRLVSLTYWWPSMRKYIDNYVKKCD